MTYVYSLGPCTCVHRNIPITFRNTFKDMAPGMIGTQRPSMLHNHLLHRAPVGRKKQVVSVPRINEMRFGNVASVRTNKNDFLTHHPFDPSIYRKKEPPPDFIKLNRLKAIASSYTNSEFSKPFKQNAEKYLKFRKKGLSKFSDRHPYARKIEEEPLGMYRLIGNDYRRRWFEHAFERNKEWQLEYNRQKETICGEQKGIILRTAADKTPPVKPRPTFRRWASVKPRINTFRT